MKRVLTYDLNEHWDGISFKTDKINFIKYQIEQLNFEGHDLGMVFRFKSDLFSEQEEIDYYDFYNKTHDFEVELEDIDEDDLELIESYGIYCDEREYYYAKNDSDMIDPLVSGLLHKPIGSFIDDDKRHDLAMWMGNMYNDFEIYNSKFYSMANDIYKKLDEPEWCIHVRATDKKDGVGALPVPTFVLCEEIEKLGIVEKPFFVMTDSDVVMNELKEKYNNIRYIKDIFRSIDGIIPLHLLHAVRKFYYEGTGVVVPSKSELWEQFILEVLVSQQCNRILMTIMTSTIHMWHYLNCIGVKDNPIILYDLVKDNSYELSKIDNYYLSRIWEHYKIHHTFDNYLREKWGWWDGTGVSKLKRYGLRSGYKILPGDL